MVTRRMFVGTVAAAGVAAIVGRVMGEEATTQKARGQVRVVLVGDSTVAEQNGWGPGFAACVKEGVEVINLAKNGRSSKSFIAEGLWKKALELKPDWVLIQFGHNDQPGHAEAIQTDPQTTYKLYMTQYVDEARAAGIKPVLVTSLSRRQWGVDGKIHSTLAPNVEVVKGIAQEKGVPLVDLHALSIVLYEKLGKAGCEELEPVKKAATGDGVKPNPASNADAVATTGPNAGKAYDGTHLNKKGQEVIGKVVAEEVKSAVAGLGEEIR